MASLTEFYLATLWAYKPKAVRRTEIIYDDEYNWFKVICREEVVDEIRRQFKTIAAQIQQDAIHNNYDGIFDTNDTLRESVDDEWIATKHRTFSAEEGTEADGIHCLPDAFSNFSHTAIWDDLDKNNETFALPDIVTGSQLSQIDNDTGATLSYDLSCRLIYIGANDKDALRKAQEKLKVMLVIKKISAIRSLAEHLMYAEDYANRGSADFTADIRYLANIDPKLVSSTLLDGLVERNLEASYQAIYREGASIRLCPWDPDMLCAVSLFGPKVVSRPGGKRILGNRPTISARQVEKLDVAPGDSTTPGQDQNPGLRSQVTKWIKTIGDDSSTDSISNSEDVPPDPTTRNPSDDSQVVSISRKLSDILLSSSSVSNAGTKPPAQLPFTGPDCLIDMLDAVETPSSSKVLDTSIHWGMPSLIPSSKGDGVSDDGETGSMERLSAAKAQQTESRSSPLSDAQILRPQPGQSAGQSMDASRFKRFLKSGSQEFQTTKNQDTADTMRQPAAPIVVKSKNPMGTGKQPTHPPGPKQAVPGQLPATKTFVAEIEKAMGRLLSSGPYRRGKVTMRAEFGRAIIKGVDDTGLAFNSPNTRSAGWETDELLKKLNVNYGRHSNFHFTKILSTLGSDAESMINTRTNGKQLWDQHPRRVWTTYSFHCVILAHSSSASSRSGRTENPFGFIVDIEDNVSVPKSFSYSIRPSNHGRRTDGLMPLYIHAIRRHWDLRIVLSHVNTEELEKIFGSFARALVRSLSISRNDEGAFEDAKFSVHRNFPVAVNAVRVLTKWRHASVNGASELEITEVEQLEVRSCSEGAYSDEDWEASSARPWTPREIQQRRSKGEVPRWYEAAVVSPAAEDLFQQNLSLGLGDKTGWDVGTLRERGILRGVYGPALQMVREMDHVGRSDDNRLAQAYGRLLFQPNNPSHEVPGALSVRGQGSSNRPAEPW
ncbi:hypothetical protein BT67DRAFT_454463 [Trichocladium antarcticum]|uniref:Uncharacterized protein n=1 Tax=Trichocladium antarcticum TaxID=1450529 RepID=A0AAN6UQ72_9PEZI|nr:hypothetical protein BT67DRAFT_454463 [Trichocladium antarcticum]